VRRVRLALRAGFLIAASVALTAGCGDDEDETTPVAPPGGPPEVWITAIRTSSGPSFEHDSGAQPTVEAGCDPDRTLSVDLAFKFFTRKPPGACGGLPQCGSVLVTVRGPDGKEHSVRSSAASVPVPLAEIEFATAGEHVFTVELRDDAGEPITVPGAVPTDSVTVEVRVPTCNPRDGGADADDSEAGRPDAAEDAGDGNDDAAPDVSDDAPPNDAGPDASDSAADRTESDSPADVEPDQG
jgi:hypothetical protein